MAISPLLRHSRESGNPPAMAPDRGTPALRMAPSPICRAEKKAMRAICGRPSWICSPTSSPTSMTCSVESRGRIRIASERRLQKTFPSERKTTPHSGTQGTLGVDEDRPGKTVQGMKPPWAPDLKPTRPAWQKGPNRGHDASHILWLEPSGSPCPHRQGAPPGAAPYPCPRQCHRQ